MDTQPEPQVAAVTNDVLEEALRRPLGTTVDPGVASSGLLTELHYDFSREYSLPMLVGSFFKVQASNEGDARSYFPVITSVRQISLNVVEIKRKLIFRRQ